MRENTLLVACSVWSRRGFTIRLKRLKPRDPDFGRPQNFGVRTISSIFVSNLFVFLF